MPLSTLYFYKFFHDLVCVCKLPELDIFSFLLYMLTLMMHSILIHRDLCYTVLIQLYIYEMVFEL